MDIKTLYRYKRENGGTTVSTEKPNAPYTECFRIIADEGKAITLDGEDLRAVVDVDNTDGWYEVDAPFTYEETDRMIEDESTDETDH